MFAIAIRKALLILALPLTVTSAVWGQSVGLQPRNNPGSLLATGGLPTLHRPGVWLGYASADSLPKAMFQASYGLGMANGGWFDLGAAITVKRVTVVGWTSGLTNRLKTPDLATSTLQRSSVLGAQYGHGDWAVFLGAQINYLSINSIYKAKSVAPVLSAETRLDNRSRLGVRFTNFSFSQEVREGVIGDPNDTTIVDPNVRKVVKAPSELSLYISEEARWKKLSGALMVGTGVGFHMPKEYLLSGKNGTGVLLQYALQAGYADKVFANLGLRMASETNARQLTYGLSVKLQQLTLQYSSFNFYQEKASRAHVLGVELSIQ